ncbi:hypothetical protein QVD17_37590 [Tagetes erecta]|uniref:Uncharacterized protein n=1 Tax=Tagetes erecta TaxID=13708 RepID=A0AAD8NJZ9_TARER|nr:hypothetical protein QVD17_37590 [Tagetes erecta]
MSKMRQMILDQQNMIKSLMSGMNEMKKSMNMSPPMTEQEIDEMMDITRYATIVKMAHGGGNIDSSVVGPSNGAASNMRDARFMPEFAHEVANVSDARPSSGS